MKKSYILLLTLILGSAFFLRVWGIRYGLPVFTHPDESHYLPRALAMLASSDPNPHYFLNPPLLTYIYAAMTGGIAILGSVAGDLIDLNDIHLTWKTDPTVFYFFARLLTGIFGTATCWLVYRVGRSLFKHEIGLLASGLLATAFLHVRDSHYAVNDVLSVFFLTWTFLLMVDIFHTGKAKRYWQAGLLAGLAVATKYNTGLIIVILPVVHFLGHPDRYYQQGTNWKFPIIFIITATIGFIIACPWILLDTTDFFNGFFKQARMAASPWLGASAENSYVQFIKALLWGYGSIPFVLSIIGIILLAEKEPRTALLIGLFPLAYLLVMGQSKLFFVRFTLPLFPFLSLLTAYGAWTVLKRLGRRKISRVAAVILVLLIIVQGALSSIRHNSLLNKKDTRIIADRWIRQHIPAGSKIIRDMYCPQIEYDFSGQLPRNYKVKVRANLAGAYVEDYREDKWQYILTSDFIRSRFEDKPGRYPDQDTFYLSLNRDAKLLFASDVCEQDVPFYFDDVYSPFWTLFRLNRPGPCVRVYQL